MYIYIKKIKNLKNLLFQNKNYFQKMSKKIFFEKIDFLDFLFFYIFRNVIRNQKNIGKFFFEKTQNNDLFMLPKQKKIVLEKALE